MLICSSASFPVWAKRKSDDPFLSASLRTAFCVWRNDVVLTKGYLTHEPRVVITAFEDLSLVEKTKTFQVHFMSLEGEAQVPKEIVMDEKFTMADYK